MAISEHTAVSHGRNIYHKFDVHNRVQLLSRLRMLQAGLGTRAKLRP